MSAIVSRGPAATAQELPLRRSGRFAVDAAFAVEGRTSMVMSVMLGAQRRHIAMH
jgi:hypothetical protein